MRDVANSATIIRTTAPKRSDQGARLKNTHHTTIANPPTSTAKHRDQIVASGTTMGTTNRTSHCSADDDHAGPQPERLPSWNFHFGAP